MMVMMPSAARKPVRIKVSDKAPTPGEKKISAPATMATIEESRDHTNPGA